MWCRPESNPQIPSDVRSQISGWGPDSDLDLVVSTKIGKNLKFKSDHQILFWVYILYFVLYFVELGLIVNS